MDTFTSTTLPSGQTLLIRTYEPADYSQVQQILVDAGLFDKIWDCEESLRRMIAEQPQSILIALIDGKIAGSVYVMTAGFWAQIYRLAVLTDYRAQGIGTLLLQQAEHVIKQKGIPQAFLFYHRYNYELDVFYAKRGWQRSSVETFRCAWKDL